MRVPVPLAPEIVRESVAIRRHLHAHPELGYEEFETSQYVQKDLAELGIRHVAGLADGTGIVAHFPATRPGAQTIALRADLDALPIRERSTVPYRSQIEGKMHACGHDGHTAILLGAARVLKASLDRPNEVLLVFQPAEEGGAGGKRMCEEGALDGRLIGSRASMAYALHGSPSLEVGRVGTRPGPIMASAAVFTITIFGTGSHGAYPHLGVDPVVVAAQIVSALQTIVSRSTDPLEAVVLTVGSVHAGTTHSVIPAEAAMQGTVRTLNGSTFDMVQARMDEMVRSIARAFGATAELAWSPISYPVLVNDAEATGRMVGIARSLLGTEAVQTPCGVSMAAEDFAFYGAVVPSCFFWLGLRPRSVQSFPPLHSDVFDFNDDAIEVGIALMSSLALETL